MEGFTRIAVSPIALIRDTEREEKDRLDHSSTESLYICKQHAVD